MSTTWKMPQPPPPLPSPVPSRRRVQLPPPPTPTRFQGWRKHRATLVSLAFHCCLFLFLALLGRGSLGRSGSAVASPVVLEATVGSEENQSFFVENIGATALGSDDSSGESALGGDVTNGGASGLPGSDSAPVDLLSGMAATPNDGGGGAGDVGLAAGGFGLGTGGSKLGGAGGMPQAKTSVFGIEGTGSRFVYIFDRSSSMNGYSGLPMANAKSELIKSLQSLGKLHQFQMVFYNETPMAYGQLSGAAGMIHGTDENKQSAIGYVRRMIPDGGTVHLSALRMGLGMSPDVIFFLTDADEPGVSGRELEDIVDRAERHGTVVHTIQFGTGSNQNSNSWIAQLAKATGGKYRYIDVSTFKP